MVNSEQKITNLRGSEMEICYSISPSDLTWSPPASGNGVDVFLIPPSELVLGIEFADEHLI